MLAQASCEIEWNAGLNKENGIETPTGRQPLGSTRPEPGKRHFPSSAEGQAVPDVEVGVAVELMVVVGRN